MKRLFLLVLPFLLIFCSDDDSTAETSGRLSKIISTSYYMGEVESKYVLEYDNGLPTTGHIYNSDNEIIWKDVYSYENGRLASVTGYENNIAITNAVYTYDSMGRITQVEHNDIDFSILYNFTYNNEGTVTRTSDSSSDRFFYTNPEGLIYKQVYNNETYEVTFDALNPISAEGLVSKTFEYLPQNPPQDFIESIAPKYGPIKANAVLADGNLEGNEDAYATKFIKKTVVDGYAIQYYYTFNDGYPLTSQAFHGDELIAETEYKY